MKDEDSALVRLTKQELVILANAINESRQAVEDWEFSSRLGAERVEADKLHVKLRQIMASSNSAQELPSEGAAPEHVRLELQRDDAVVLLKWISGLVASREKRRDAQPEQRALSVLEGALKSALGIS